MAPNFFSQYIYLMVIKGDIYKQIPNKSISLYLPEEKR